MLFTFRFANKFLNANLSVPVSIFCKVLYSKLSNKLALQRNIHTGLRKKVNNNGFLVVIIT